MKILRLLFCVALLSGFVGITGCSSETAAPAPSSVETGESSDSKPAESEEKEASDKKEEEAAH